MPSRLHTCQNQKEEKNVLGEGSQVWRKTDTLSYTAAALFQFQLDDVTR